MAKKPEWLTQFVEYPNPAASGTQTSIKIGELAAIYYHVDGGFKTEKYRKNAKLYSTESEIRGVLLRGLLAQTRKAEREILAAIESVD